MEGHPVMSITDRNANSEKVCRPDREYRLICADRFGFRPHLLFASKMSNYSSGFKYWSELEQYEVIYSLIFSFFLNEHQWYSLSSLHLASYMLFCDNIMKFWKRDCE